MKRALMILLAFMLAGINTVLMAGDTKELEPFHSIIVSSEIVAELILSKNEAIELDFKNAEEENLILEVVDSVLKLRMKTGKYKDANLEVRIHYNKDLRMLEANGRAQIWSEEDLYFDKDLTVKLFNGGEMRFKLFCDSLDATLSQGAVIYLKGKTRALQVKSTTNATFSGYEFESQDASVTASGTGKVKVSVSHYLNANSSSKGFVGYVGDPKKVNEKTSLGGEILKTFLEE
jgi:hypothetical protein